MSIELPAHCSPRKAVILREETASSHLLLNAEIDQFHLEKEGEEQGELVVQVSDSEDEPDRFSSVRTSGLVIACIDNNFEVEGKEMALNKKKGLRELLTDRAKGPAKKDTSGSQPFPALPPPPPPPPSPTVNLLPMPNLKKKRKEKEIAEEGEVVRQKESKQQKMAKGQRGTSSVESKED